MLNNFKYIRTLFEESGFTCNFSMKGKGSNPGLIGCCQHYTRVSKHCSNAKFLSLTAGRLVAAVKLMTRAL